MSRRTAYQRSPSARALVLAASVVLAAAALGLVNSSADITVKNQPASEGRRITPAGSLLKDLTTGLPAVGSLPVNFVRSPDRQGPGGRGRFLVVVNSGYGVQFDAKTNRGQQSLAVIDLNARPPVVTQNVYFPEPQSANVGAVFSPRPGREGSYTLYVSGGFENKVWTFDFRPNASKPITPGSDGPDTKVVADSIDVSGFATRPVDPRYNDGLAAVYPTGLALSPDGETLYVANNLGDSLGIIHNLNSTRGLERIDLAVGDGVDDGDAVVIRVDDVETRARGVQLQRRRASSRRHVRDATAAAREIDDRHRLVVPT